MRLFEENSEYINDNSIIELIYVVADGEGSEVERQLVFSTIANNTELQKEFQNAIKMNKVGELEIQNSTPPAHLTDNLMTNLGFDEVTNLDKKKEEVKLDSKTNKKYKFNNKIKNSIILLLLLFSSGYIGYILGGIDNSLIQKKYLENELVVNQEKILNEITEKVEKKLIEKKLLENIDNQNLVLNNIKDESNLEKAKYNSKLIEHNNSENIFDTNTNDLSVENHNDNHIKEETIEISQVNPIYENATISNKVENNNKLSNNFKSININKKQNNFSNHSFITENQINFLDLILQFKNSVFSPNSTNKEQVALNDNQNLTDNKDWIIQFNTKNDFQFSHDLFSENINNQLRSFELIALYKIDDNLFLGGKIGNEYLPIYYINGKNYDLVKNFYHISGNLRYILPNQKFIVDDILQPYINLSLGGASAGLFSGLGVGGNVYIYSNVNLNFGVEINNLTYFNNNGYFNINKTSTNIGLSYLF